MTVTKKRNPLAFWRWELHWQALLGVLIGVILGYFSGQAQTPGDPMVGRWDMQV
jgi:hypothetical protein